LTIENISQTLFAFHARYYFSILRAAASLYFIQELFLSTLPCRVSHSFLA